MKSRVFLFSPGSDRQKAEKAIASAADFVILDLEDAVAPSEKEQARVQIVEMLTAYRNRPIIVRINALSTLWALQDLLSVIPTRPYGILVPKTESASDVGKVSWLIEQLMGPDSGMWIYPLLETGAGIENVKEIALASKDIKQLVFGALDYCLDLGVEYQPDSDVLMSARTRIVNASAMAKLPGPIDTVYPVVKDGEGLRQDTLTAKKLGFKGKLIIHPSQIEIVQQVFSPSEHEIDEAKDIIKVYEQAKAEGKGAIQWKGKMLDEPVLKRALQVLEEYGE